MKHLLSALTGLAACVFYSLFAPATAEAGTYYAVFTSLKEATHGNDKVIALLRNIVSLSEQNAEVAIYDARTANSIYRFRVEVRSRTSEARNEYFNEKVMDNLVKGLTGSTIPPIQPGTATLRLMSKLDSPNSLNLPAIIRRLANIRQENAEARIMAVLVGSPYFSYTVGESGELLLPDSVLCNKSSPLHIAPNEPKGFEAHFFFVEAPELATNTCAYDHQRRFVNLYLGGQLLTFSSDFEDYRRLASADLRPQADKLDCSNNKIERCVATPLLFAEEVPNPIRKAADKARKKPVRNYCK